MDKRRFIGIVCAIALLVGICAVWQPAGVLAAASPYQIDISTLPNRGANNANADRIQAILTVVFSIIGALSLLFVTIGGFRYVASQGDPQAATRAKGTIIYALVGLLVSVISVAIVTFVLGRV